MPSDSQPVHSSVYRGRFAPSPTGPLHFGSLIAATASYLQARAQQGEWFVRIDDIDPPREVPGISDDILRTLEKFGFEWDGPVYYQSRNHSRYLDALQQLREDGLIYPCDCSRKSLQERTGQESGYIVYPGFCRHKPFPLKSQYATRLRINTSMLMIMDGIQGERQWRMAEEIGDYILQRADGFFSYQLATGIDDAEQGVSQVVRGMDLLDSTPRQIYVQQCLGLDSPAYAHFPVATASNGQKLSKQNLAPAIKNNDPLMQLWAALAFLGQQPDEQLKHDSVDNLWQWAIQHWQIHSVPATAEKPVNMA